jgi:hypothetical protein
MLLSRLFQAFFALVFATMSLTAAADPTSEANTLEISGLLGNELYIIQSPSGGHIAQITVSGTNSESAGETLSTKQSLFDASAISSLSQSGIQQTATIDISGVGNLFSVAQSGQGNVLSAKISGTANTAIVQQTGIASRTTFIQSGQGNRLSVYQSM